MWEENNMEELLSYIMIHSKHLEFFKSPQKDRRCFISYHVDIMIKWVKYSTGLYQLSLESDITLL